MIIICSFSLHAQNAFMDTIRPIKIGEKVPDILIKDIYNYKKSFAKLSELYQDRLLILDFWAVTCAICVQTFPKLHQLQNEFSTSLRIMPVGLEDPNFMTIRDFLKDKEGGPFALKLPYSVQHHEETLLKKLFPFRTVPHLVWINNAGVVVAITGHQELCRQAIDKAVRGVKPGLYEKRDKKIYAINNNSRKIIIDYERADGKTDFGTRLTGYIDTLRSGIPGDRQLDSRITRIFSINASIASLYQFAYMDSISDFSHLGFLHRIDYPDDRSYIPRLVALRFDNSVSEVEKQKFNQDSLFSYEAIYPSKISVKQAKTYMVYDLDRFFGLTSRIEKKILTCWALINLEKKQIKGPTDHTNTCNTAELVSIDNKIGYKYYKVTTERISSFVATQLYNYLIVDETDSEDVFNLTLLPIRPNSIAEMRDQLRSYGFDLVPREKEMDILVLRR
ncbi:Thiol-disulfide isomerase or thioredoxin [bacterium A37T11]|nr:Thiol-disulfide isomerase or thioredoxin [bacterium A37T11]